MAGVKVAGVPETTTVWPTVVIAGAPRSGTTSMFHYLSGHSQVAACRVKEPHYFATDLAMEDAVRERGQYSALFETARPVRHRLEASVWYLFSQTAAQRMSAEIPDVHLVLMLRNPLQSLPSLHAHHAAIGLESITDFMTAYTSDRRPSTPDEDFRRHLCYREVGRYGAQVRRLLQHVPRSHVLVVRFEDFVADPAAAYRQVEGFLELPHEPVGEYRAVNVQQTFRSRRVQAANRAMRRRVRGWPRPMLRRVALKSLGQVSRANTMRPAPDLRLAPDERARVAADLRPDVEDLSEVLDDDYLDWLG